jgi:hypothetical protein
LNTPQQFDLIVLVRAGIEVVQDCQREDAQGVFRLYHERGGPIYNG